MIIAPEEGFRTLSIDNEGNDVAKWCTDRGIAAFVLKYRLVPTGENPSQEFMAKFQAGQEEMFSIMAPYIELANADGLAAIAHVREKADEYGVKPDQIGIIGFSAGGTVAAAAGLAYTDESNRPDFIAPIYAAMNGLDIQTLPEKPMPLFMAVSGDDFFGFQNQANDINKS
ncbi:MAG: alpha/beta hydrolase fold domain-containing protein [Bacteroidota bacterium]